MDAPTPGRGARVDETDRRLIDLLIEDGRTSNRKLAAQVGLTEVTVAARLRNLTERKAFRVGALIDWRAAGFTFGVTMMVEVEGVEVVAVGEELAGLSFVYFVGAIFGSADLVANALVSTYDDVRWLTDRVSSVRGVTRVTIDIAFDTTKYHYRYAMISQPPAALHLPNPVVPVDDLDHRIISALINDGRTANRELARTLGCSEGTIRGRLRRLEDAGLLSIRGQLDPFLLGELGAFAYVGIAADGASIATLVERLIATRTVFSCSRTTGRHQLILAVGADERSTLVNTVMKDIQSLPGVRSTETWEIVRFIKMSSYLVRFVAH